MQVHLCNDPVAWNAALQELGGTFHQSWEWGEARAMQGWNATRVLLCKQGATRAAVNILSRTATPLGHSILYAPCGVAAHPDDVEAITESLTALRNLAASRNAIFLRMDAWFDYLDTRLTSSYLAGGCVPLTEQFSLWSLPRAMMVVDLARPDSEVLRAMRPTHREYIKRAERSGLSFESGLRLGQVEEFFALLRKTSQRQGFATMGLDYFIRFRDTLSVQNRGRFFLARYGGVPVAGLLCAYLGRECFNLYAGFDWDFRQAKPTEALHWQAMRWAVEQGCTRYNMGGASTSYPAKQGNSGFNLYHFKKGFGARLEYHAGYFDIVIKPLLYQAARFAERHLTAPRGHAILCRLLKLRSMVRNPTRAAHLADSTTGK